MSVTMQHPTRAAGRLFAVLAALLAVLAIASTAAHAGTVRWDQFETPGGPAKIMPDGDRVQLQRTSGAPAGFIQIVLNTRTTWRKGVESMRRTNVCGLFGCSLGYQLMNGVYLQDADHGPASMLVPLNDARDPNFGYGQLRLAKAKLFGVLTPVYDLPWDATHVRSGDRYTFTWLTD